MSIRRPLSVIASAFVATALLACQGSEGDREADVDAEATTPPGVVQVTAKDFEFEAPDEIPSGWTTIRFENAGEQEHFVVLWRLPPDRTFREHKTEVAGNFVSVWNRYDAGRLTREETLEELAEQLPELFFEETVPRGGAALTEPGETSQATVHLEPGTYVLECYVKTPQGTWHTDLGMLRELTVTEATNGAAPPEADVELTLSNYEIATSGELAAGARTVAVHVEGTPDGLMPHDINLVRLDGEASLDEVVGWMDWMDLERFRAPAPGHWLGGVKSMTSGNTGYFTVDLEPGRYAWVSENYADRGMVREFTVE